MDNEPQTKEIPEVFTTTSDVNLATYIKVVKQIDSCGHYFEGRQLFLKFPITEGQMREYREEYINSTYSIYDATKRNYLRLLK